MRRNLLIAAGVAVVALAAVVLVWFQPQKLFIDQAVDEAPDTPSASEPARTDASMTRAGTFESLEHATTGTATVRKRSDGTAVLRLEDFETSNGPDLRVWLSAGDKGSYAEEFVDLGPL